MLAPQLRPLQKPEPGMAPQTRLPATPLQAFLGRLLDQQQLQVVQRFEQNELIWGLESRNKYEIKLSDDSLIGFAVENGRSLGAFFLRQFMGHWRTFTVNVFDAMRQPLFVVTHPFQFILQRMDISDTAGVYLGGIRQRWAFFHRIFDITDARGKLLATIRSPIWTPWTFRVLRGEREVAVLRKKFAGVFTEAFTDKDRYTLEFADNRMDSQVKVMLLTATVLIDIIYFEKQGNG
jgi:uncharacterized protein YxjI